MMWNKIWSVLVGILVSLTGLSPAVFTALPPRPAQTFYIDAQTGNDKNPGTVDAPLRSADALQYIRLQKGDEVLFHSGSVFRYKLRCVPGVRYAAYGEGEKPVFLGSLDGASPALWVKTKTENVWKYTKRIHKDVGNIIFDEGEACGFKGETLRSDLQFTHAKLTGELLLYSVENPGDRFQSVEIATEGHVIRLGSSCTVEGLRLLYGGSHGIQGKNVHDVTVRDCEIGFMGGCRPEGRNRLGNGIELWESAKDVLVENCYIYQIYDAGLTFQSDNGLFENITFRNNRVERCTYGLEYFNGDKGLFRNITIQDNEFYYAGYGWGSQRPDTVHTSAVNAWQGHANRCENFVLCGNTFAGSTQALLRITSTIDNLPTLSGNAYMQYHKDCMLTPEMKFGKDEARTWIQSLDPTATITYCHNPMA